MDFNLNIFQSPEFTGQIASLPGCQILNDKDPKVVGLFIKEEALKLCGWKGETGKFEHTFQSGKSEKGWHSKSPRMHVIARSPRFIELRETKELIGNYETPQGRKSYAELGETAALRSFYMIYLVDKDNETLHQVPLVLSIYGIAAARFGKAWQQFRTQMEVTYSIAMNEGYRALNEKFHVLTVFQPTFVPSLEPADAQKKSWVAIPESVAVPNLAAIDPKSPNFLELAQKELGKYICIEKHAQLWPLAASSQNFANKRLPLPAAEEPEISAASDPERILQPQTLDAKAEPVVASE